MRWAESGVPPALRFAGAPLCVLALLIGRNVFRALGPNVTPTAQTRRNHTLVTDGPYRLVRHPLYLSGFILAAGYWLLTASWLVLLGGCLTLAVISLRTVREEANLVRRFGAEYEAYRARTGRFFPRIRSARASRSRGRQVSGAP
jgi:protein-S-isoprenylcysteine O-methyltransferase Ste14